MVLENHRREGKKFIPPAKHMLNFTEVHYVERILPEIIWIGAIIHALGAKDGIRIALEIITSAYDLSSGGRKPDFSLISAYRLLNDDQKSVLLRTLEEKGVLVAARESLTPFLRTYSGENPLAFLGQGLLGNLTDEDLEKVKEVISKNHDRRSFDAVVTQSVVLRCGVLTGKLKYTSNVRPPDLESLFRDFESGEAKHVAAQIRMAVTQVFMFYEKDIGDDWARYFWNHGLQLESAKTNVTAPDLPEKPDGMHPAYLFALRYEKIAVLGLNAVWQELPKDLLKSEQSEVIGALLARQCYLSVKLCRNPDFWEWNVGPLILRSMTDCYITLAWILKDPELHAKQYISYGLGQEKLNIEYYKEQFKQDPEEGDREILQIMIDAQEDWLNTQHFSFLQEVDVGSWSGMSTREMALECGCIDLYHFAYTPYSTCAHNVWNHIGKFNCAPSDNPLHKFMREPAFLEMAAEPSVFMNSAKYLQKAYRVVCDAFALKPAVEMPYDWATENIEQLGRELEKYQGRNAEP